MQQRTQDITISEENLKTPESRQILRYILDRGEVQVEFNVRMRAIEDRLRKLNLDQNLWIGSMTRDYKALLKAMSTRDVLIEGAAALRGYLQDFEELVSKLEDEAKKTNPAFDAVIENDFHGFFQHKFTEFYNDVNAIKPLLPDINYAEIGPTEVIPVFNEKKTSFRTVKLDNLGLLSRLRGEGKSGAVLEVLQGETAEGGHAFVMAVPYKVIKHGDHDTQVLTHGIDTSYQYVDKYTPGEDNLDLFRAEVELLTDLPHTHYKESMERHALMRDLPNTELKDILYDEKKKFVIEPKKSGDFFIQFATNLFQAYQQQIEDRKIVHRDIKPDNIRVELLDTDKGPMIGEMNFIDFNISHRFNASSVGGSPYYSFPPEVAKKHPDAITATTATDVYGLGITLIETVVNLVGFGKELKEVREQFADEFNEELKKLTKGGEPNPHLLDKLFFKQQQDLMRLLKQSLERTDLAVEERKELQTLIDQMLSPDPKERPTIPQTLQALADLDFQHTKTQIVESYFEKEFDLVLSNAEFQLKIIQDDLNRKMAHKELLLNNNNNSKESFDNVIKLQAEIQALENKKTEWEQVIQKTKDEIMQPYLNDSSHSARIDTTNLSAVRDKILPALQSKLTQLHSQNGAMLASKGILQNFSQLKSAFSEIKDQNQITKKNIDYLVRNLGIKAFRDVREWPYVRVKLDNIEFGLMQNLKLLQDSQNEIQRLIQEAETKNYPEFDISKLKTMQKELKDFIHKIQQTPADIDSMSKAVEKMAKRNHRISQVLVPEIVALELVSTKREFLRMLNDETQSKKASFLERKPTSEQTKKHQQELTAIISNAKDVKTLISGVNDYVKDLPTGFFRAEGIKQRMESAIKNVSKEVSPRSGVRKSL